MFPDGGTRVIAQHTWRLQRRGALAWAVILAFLVGLAVVGYDNSYPTRPERARFAAGFAHNVGVQAITGISPRLDVPGGFLAGRLGVLGATTLAIWGLLSATRALRLQEEAGRWDTIRSGAVSARTATVGALVGLLQAAAAIWAVLVLTLLGVGTRADLPVRHAVFFATVLVLSGVAFAALGAFASQLAATTRGATTFAALVLGAAYLVRLVADGAADTGWLRWASPLGWVEESRPFAGSEPGPLALLTLWSVLFAVAAVFLAGRRDTASGLVARSGGRPAGDRLLRSPLELTLRLNSPSVLAWALGTGAFAAVVGAIAPSVVSTRAATGGGLMRDLSRGAATNTVEGYLSFAVFFFLAVILSLLTSMHVSAIRAEESSLRLETLFARPVGRRRWIAMRGLVALASAGTVAVFAAASTWLGGAVSNAGLPLSRSLLAALNCLPVAVLFLGIGLLLCGILPDYAHLTPGLVGVSVAWELIGSVAGTPPWTLGLSPFHHVAAYPATPVEVPAALAMLAIGTACGLLGAAAFARRGLRP